MAGQPFRLNPVQHGQRQVRHRGSLRPSGVVSVDNLDNRAVQIFQTVKYKLVSVSQILSKPLHHGFVGFENQMILRCENNIPLCHKTSPLHPPADPTMGHLVILAVRNYIGGILPL